MEKQVTKAKTKVENSSRKDKNHDLSTRSIEKETEADPCFQCNLCGKTFKNKTSMNAHIRVHHNEKYSPSCNHVMQCTLRRPKAPPRRKFQNGDGMTVSLPNQARRDDVVNYEIGFGDHECEDCNQESIVCEQGCIYRVRSCGNNLVKFEGFEWWIGEGDFKSRKNMMCINLVDLDY